MGVFLISNIASLLATKILRIVPVEKNDMGLNLFVTSLIRNTNFHRNNLNNEVFNLSRYVMLNYWKILSHDFGSKAVNKYN